MGFGVFIHRSDSIYNDRPAEQYQFPSQYLRRVEACVGDWIIYYEPSKVDESRGYFAVAKVQYVIPDPAKPDMYLALIEPGTYLDFANPVPFNGANGIVEKSVLNEEGRISGRADLPSAQSVQVISIALSISAWTTVGHCSRALMRSARLSAFRMSRRHLSWS